MGNSSGKPVVFTEKGLSPVSHFFRNHGHAEIIAVANRFLAALRQLTWAEIVNLNHFRLLRVVGKGAFGKVRIVERKDTGLTFALKYIRKDEGLFPEPYPRSLCCESRSLIECDSKKNSCSIGECAEYNTGATHVGAFEPSISLQSSL